VKTAERKKKNLGGVEAKKNKNPSARKVSSADQGQGRGRPRFLPGRKMKKKKKKGGDAVR